MSRKYIRPTSFFLLLAFLFETFVPSISYALTGGPSQPEVQSFEPIGTTELVDLFSGDFNYNIPIMDIDGYPINLAYHSGVTMDQEASWVGLGWNLNPGVINRNMRGVPDDFNGEEIQKELRHESDYTIGINAGLGAEMFGFDGFGKLKKLTRHNKASFKKATKIDISVNLGINYNNFRGLGFDFGITPSISGGNKVKTKFSLSLDYSSNSGASLQPQLGMQGKLGKIGYTSLGGGLNLNSRDGLKAVNLKTKFTENQFATGASYNSFSTQTYMPSISMPMENSNAAFKFKMGTTFWGLNGTFDISGYYNEQWLANDNIKRKAYGTQYLQNSNNDENILDFSREKDGSVSSKNPVIGIPQLSQDLYNYSGQGVGGMFKTYRNDIPVVSDPATYNNPNYGGNIGVEIGAGNIAEIGADIAMNYSKSNSRRWRRNGADIFEESGIKSYTKTNNPLFENSYLKNIGEKTPTDTRFNPYNNLDENFKLNFLNPFNIKNLNFSNGFSMIGIDNKAKYHRDERDKRNIYIKKLNNDESDFCLDKQISFRTSDGPNASKVTQNRLNDKRKNSHNTEMTVVKPDGTKYVYGIPAYNTSQLEYSFTNSKDVRTKNCPTVFCQTGEVAYNTAFSDFQGIDKHKEVITTPSYAHSYLLTNILSADYQDVDNNGTSVNDIGTYTKINYLRADSNYKWRVPYNQNRANYNEGLKSDKYDDNANFVYGTKEIWHVHSIEGKNQVAYFYISEREDGFGVSTLNGGLGLDSKSYKLDSIVLFSRFDLNTPIKTAVFEYDYYLCPNVPNNKNTTTTASNGINPYTAIDPNSGKLTLRKIYFKYGKSNKGKYNSYKFDYRDNQTEFNKPYHLKGYDSWGNYKPASMNIIDGVNLTESCNNNTVLLSKEFPYVEQNKTLADQYSTQWTLSKIYLPSGGVIEVEYESDDYAFVQDKTAMQMYRLLGFGNSPTSTPNNFLYSDNANENNNYLFIEVPVEADIKNLIKDIDQMYYNVLVDIDNNGNYEYVRGYAKLQDVGVKSTETSTKTVWVKIETVKIDPDNVNQINPISAAGFNFARINLPFIINPDANSIKSNNSNLESFSRSLYGFWPEMYNMFRGQNFALVDKEFCCKAIAQKSWIRLNNATGFKFGGGCRVKKIISNDNWAEMEQSESSVAGYRSNKFTQVFDYTTEAGLDNNGVPIKISSGVAIYEPQAGGDENPFREFANTYSKENTFVPDEDFFTERPYGESYYPSASVGYSKVTVKSGNDSYTEESITRNGTGKVVNEFYTAKDFPTIVPNHEIDIDESGNSFIWTILYTDVTKKLRTLQSHRIELNDMHGKPKAVWNYNHSNVNSNKVSDAYSGIKYEYYEKTVEGKHQLENKVKVVGKDGKISDAIVSVDSEVIIDSREFNSYSFSGGVNLNLNVTLVGFIPVPVLTGFPDLSSEETQFQSASSMKMINRYGILKRTIAFEEGASLTTENTVFDAQTGEVLVTKTQNEFDDYIYNTTYPAHWVYEGMGQAYKNQGAELKIINTTNSGLKVVYNGVNQNPELFLYHGDLIKLGSSNSKYWVYNLSNVWKIMDEFGNFLTTTSLSTTNPIAIKIMDSGRKNMQSMPIATYSQLDNPATSNFLNNSTNILNSAVTEYDSLSRKQNCFKPITNSLCLSGESSYLMEYFFKKIIEAKILNLDTAGYSHNGYFDTTFTTNNDLFSNYSKYKEIYDQAYPNTTLYPVRIFLSYTGNSSSTYQFKFGYELAELNYTKGCNNYKTFLSARGVTFALNSTNNPTHTCDGKIYDFYNCKYLTDLSLTGKSEIIIDYENQLGCDCNPSNCSNCVESFDPETGICFDGYLPYYAVDQGLSSNSTNSLPYPYNTFPNNYYNPVLVRTKSYPNDTFTTRNAIIYYNSKYLKTDMCNSIPVTENINPFKNGIQNNWKTKRNWVYLEKRTPENGGTNIRKDGIYKNFDNFWLLSSASSKFTKNVTPKWQYTKETTKYNSSGAELESKNALGIFNAALYGYNNTLPVAVANNCKYNQILNLNFEKEASLNNNNEKYKVSCPAVHQMYDLQTLLVDTTYFHTGYSSYKVIDTNYVVSTYANGQIEALMTNTGASDKFTSKYDNYLGVFEPSEGKYLISCWVNTAGQNSSLPGILVVLKNTNTTNNERIINLKPTGPIIDGWQKIEGTFIVSNSSNGATFLDKKIIIKLYSGSNQAAYFDDLRIMPFNAAMNTYVYDSKSLKLAAELDDNNYATFYEYDKEGNLIRIKKETEKGIVTIKEVRNSFKKSN